MYTLLLLILPFVTALVGYLLDGKVFKHIAFVSSLIQLGITLYIYHAVTDSGLLQFSTPWIESVSIQFKVGLDGIGFLLVLLTNLLVPFIIFSSYKGRTYSDNQVLYSLILFMQSALIGVFTAYDCFLFYVCWEAALIPVYFISGIWGGENKVKVTFKFFIYTIFGSLFMLIGILYLYLQSPGDHSFDYFVLNQVSLDSFGGIFVFACFFLAFAIKVPMFPFHTWQPDTYTVSPTPATMLLSGIMLKMGFFGMLRWVFPITPLASIQYSGIIVLLSVIGVIYASVLAIQQLDFKRLVAYSSIAHVALILTGLFTLNIHSMQGAFIQMFNHGINAVGLFYVLEIIAQRTGTRTISELGGIAHKAPKLAIAFVIIMLGTVALPLTNGFAGEFLLLMGLYEFQPVLGAMAGITIILGAVYMLRMYKSVMLGPVNEKTQAFTDIQGNELWVLTGICVLVVGIGIYPKALLQITQADAQSLVEFLTKSSLSPLGLR